MITIIDYNTGNLRSVANMLKKVGVESEITNDVDKIKNAKKIILPGVGAFDNAMDNLTKLNLRDVLTYKAMEEKVPLLGICLGMQIMTNSSEEGKTEGLGWINADVVKFKDLSVKVPHMGWNQTYSSGKSKLFSGLEESAKFYYLHSFHLRCNNSQDEIAYANYPEKFTCSVQKDNLFAVQFHPEKSLKYGMKLLSNFAEM